MESIDLGYSNIGKITDNYSIKRTKFILQTKHLALKSGLHKKRTKRHPINLYYYNTEIQMMRIILTNPNIKKYNLKTFESEHNLLSL